MRTETVTREIFQFSELDDSAKEAAREWYRAGALDYEWWECTIDDFVTIAATLGIETSADKVFFSGFYSQGDGASFHGSYSYKKGAAKAIRDYAPTDETLHAIADRLQDVQRRNFYRLSAELSRNHYAGNYYHENTVSIDVFKNGEPDDNFPETADEVRDIMRDLMRWLYRTLEAEHDYLLSDEAVDETIKANDYEFTEEGERA